eukprot:TRINITY_DN5854_c0_g1_i1.p2 TRINITY_DN5854_c0_g1~~TRINITY_DN5854_c0_g1_i1.p2  ORF type:complete len:423 (-),score=46.55 TRINITY_DN5854_c0_g1_i1:1994-3262(-)
MVLDYGVEQPPARHLDWNELADGCIRNIYLEHDKEMSTDDCLKQLEQRPGALKFCIWSLFVRHGSDADSARYLDKLTTWVHSNMATGLPDELEGALRCLNSLPSEKHRALKKHFWHQAIAIISPNSTLPFLSTLGNLTGELLDEKDSLEPLWSAAERCKGTVERRELLNHAIFTRRKILETIPEHDFSIFSSNAYRFIQSQTFEQRRDLIEEMSTKLPPHMLDVFLKPLVLSHNVRELVLRLWIHFNIVDSLSLRPTLEVCDLNQFRTDSLEFLFRHDINLYSSNSSDYLKVLTSHMRLESRLGPHKVAELLFEQHQHRMNHRANSNILDLLAFDEFERKLFIPLYSTPKVLFTIGGIRLLRGFKDSERDKFIELRDHLCRRLGITFDESVTSYEATDETWTRKDLALQLERLCGVTVTFVS